MKSNVAITVAALFVIVCGGLSIANKANDGDGICITVSPNTLVLSCDTGSVSVHTNVPIGLVDCSSVLLEGVTPYLVKADSCGHLVAKFDSSLIKEVVEPGQATLTFTGLLKDSTVFAVADTITVKP